MEIPNFFLSKPYEKIREEGLLQLPNELLMIIFSFLVGDVMNDRDFSTVETNVDHNNCSYPIHPQARALIPPFQNLITIMRLNLVCKDFHSMIYGSTSIMSSSHEEPTAPPEKVSMHDFEMFWLRGFNFYFKFLYWLRTRKLEGISLAFGDLSQMEYIEMAKGQNIILHYERGIALESFDTAFDYPESDDDIEMDAIDNNDEEKENQVEPKKAIVSEPTETEVETESDDKFFNKIFGSRKPAYNNPNDSKQVLMNRFKDLEIHWKHYLKYFKEFETSFQLCIDVMIMVSLEMFNSFVSVFFLFLGFDSEDTSPPVRFLELPSSS